MVIITFSAGADWFKANWVFRQLAEDTVAANPNDGELLLALEKAQAFGHLTLDSMDPGLAAIITQAIRKVAEETIAGKISGWKRTHPEDLEGQRMYLESISELLNLMSAKAGAA